MINQLLCFSFLGEVADTIVTAIIIIAVVICIAIMAKYENTRKFLLFVLGIIIIAVGILSTIGIIKEVRADSYVRGSIEIPTQSQEMINYSATQLTLYGDDAGVYSYIATMQSVDFNGEKYKYQTVFNGYTLLNIEYGAGYILAEIPVRFYDVQGQLQSTATINLSIWYLSNETRIKIAVIGAEQAQNIEQYVKDNGIRICVEKLY